MNSGDPVNVRGRLSKIRLDSTYAVTFIDAFDTPHCLEFLPKDVRDAADIGFAELRDEVQALYDHCVALSRYNHSRQDAVEYDADTHELEKPTPLQVARDRAWHLGKEEAYTRLAERLRGMKLRYAITGASRRCRLKSLLSGTPTALPTGAVAPSSSR